MGKRKKSILWSLVFTFGCFAVLYFVLSVILYLGYNYAILALGIVMVLLPVGRLRNGLKALYGDFGRPYKIAVVAIAAAALVSFIIVEGLIIRYAVRDGDAERADYLMILGGGLKGEALSKSLEKRMEVGLEYLEKYPGTPVIVSGGQGRGEDITEAEAMKRYLVEHGIAADTVITEDRSTSTYENFKFTREVLGEAAAGDNTSFAVVTSDFHMFRSKLLAKRQGFIMYEVPAPTPWYVAPNCYVREYFAVVKSVVFDR